MCAPTPLIRHRATPVFCAVYLPSSPVYITAEVLKCCRDLCVYSGSPYLNCTPWERIHTVPANMRDVYGLSWCLSVRKNKGRAHRRWKETPQNVSCLQASAPRLWKRSQSQTCGGARHSSELFVFSPSHCSSDGRMFCQMTNGTSSLSLDYFYRRARAGKSWRKMLGQRKTS